MASEWRTKMSLRVKKYLKVMSFLSSWMTGIGALLPRQADVRAKAVFQSRAFVAGVHDAAARAGDDHEPGFGNLAAEFDRLLVFHLGRLRARGAEDGHLALVRVGRKELEGVAQFAQRGLDDAHVAAVLDVGQQFERVFHDVLHRVGIVSAALVGDQFLDAPF